MGCPWRDLPEEFGSWNSVYARFARRSDKQVWQRVFAMLRQDADFAEVFLDSTVIRAHQHAAGAAKKGPQALGRSRVDWRPKFMLVSKVLVSWSLAY
jgi:transposase